MSEFPVWQRGDVSESLKVMNSSSVFIWVWLCSLLPHSEEALINFSRFDSDINMWCAPSIIHTHLLITGGRNVSHDFTEEW